MKAMPEARIVAARIQGLAGAVHGISAVVDWITASSQGGFMAALDAFYSELAWRGWSVKNTSVP
jgi:hypothetical protein